MGSWLRGDQGAGIKGLGSRGWEQGCSAQQPLLSYRACCSALPSPKYQGLMRPQIRETSAAENRIPFLLILKNVCGYLNSPTSLADPQHLANAPRAALHHLPARPALMWQVPVIESCDALKHFWHGAGSGGGNCRLRYPELPTAPASPL